MINPDIAKKVLLTIILEKGASPFSFNYFKHLRIRLDIGMHDFMLSKLNNPYIVDTNPDGPESEEVIEITQAGIDLVKEYMNETNAS